MPKTREPKTPKTNWRSTLSSHEIEQHILLNPRELIQKYEKKLTTAQIDACIFEPDHTIFRPFQHRLAQRVGIAAIEIIPHRLEPRHFDYLAQTQLSSLISHYPDLIPEKYLQDCIEQHTWSTLTYLIHRLSNQQLEKCIRKERKETQALLRRRNWTLNGKSLARRILLTPELDVPKEIRNAAARNIAKEI
jgi:hypothetical protein